MVYFKGVVFVFLICCLVALVSPAEANFPVLQYQLVHWRARSCPLHAVDFTDCEPYSNNQSIGVHAAPGIAVAFIVGIVAPLYLIAKYMLNWCGGRSPSPNFCFPLAGVPGKYDKFDLLRPVICAVLVFVLCLTAAFWGIAAQRRLSANVSGLNDVAKDTVKIVEDKKAEILRQLMNILPNTKSNAAHTVSPTGGTNKDEELFFLELEGYSAEISRMLNDLVIDFFSQFNTYSWLISLLFVLSTLVSFVGVICAVFNYRKYVVSSIFLIIVFLSIFAWVCNGICAGYSFTAEEHYHELFEFANRRANIVKVLSNCDDTKFSNYVPFLEKTLTAESKEICETIKKHCRATNESFTKAKYSGKYAFDCLSSDISCSDMTDVSLVAMVRNLLCANPQSNSLDYNDNMNSGKTIIKCQSVSKQNCDLSNCTCTCAKDGVINAGVKLLKSVLSPFSSIVNARSVIDILLGQFGSCDAVLADVVPPLVIFCEGASAAMNDLMNSTGLLGVALLIGLYAYGIGSKRFIPFNQAFLPQTG